MTVVMRIVEQACQGSPYENYIYFPKINIIFSRIHNEDDAQKTNKFINGTVILSSQDPSNTVLMMIQ